MDPRDIQGVSSHLQVMPAMQYLFEVAGSISNGPPVRWLAALLLMCVGCAPSKKNAAETQTPVGKPPPAAASKGPQRPEPPPAPATYQSEPAQPANSAPNAAANSAVASQLFVDTAMAAGVDFSYNNGRSSGEFAIIESLGGGVGVLDYDLDGRPDLMFAGGGRLDNKTVSSLPCRLFRNLTPASADSALRFVNATRQAQAAADAFFTHGVFPGDFDGDGFMDVAVSGYGGVQLLVNMGDGSFAPQAPLITNTSNAWSSSLAWADLDNNGHLDLYVAHYVDWSWDKHPICPGQAGVEREVCAPREFAEVQDSVYLNDGSQLRQVASEIGLHAGGKGLGVVIGDVNVDGFVDIYIANDTTDNYLYLNNGHGVFSESAVLAGVSGDDAGVSTGSMGLCFFDANDDQLPDIFVTNFERELSALYRNEGQGFFTYASRQAGFAAFPAGSVGFGTVCLDFDFDGDQDIVVANGHVSYQSPHAPYRQLPHVFANDQGQFRKLQLDGYFGSPHTGRGLAKSDLDNNGSMDLVLSNLEDPVAILKSTVPPAKNWGLVRLIGRKANRDAIGASLSITEDGKTRTQYVVGGGSYLSQSDLRLLVHWSANATEATVSVHWPSGESEEFQIAPGRENTLVQGLR